MTSKFDRKALRLSTEEKAVPVTVADNNDYALDASAVVAGYGSKTIVQQLDLHVRPGEIYALLGANGAGKTTTLSLFLGFLAPRAGQVRVQGVDRSVPF